MSLLDLLLPPACSGCGRPAALLCRRCVENSVPASSASDRFVVPDAGVAIGDEMMLAVSAFAHVGSIRRALAMLKYSGAARVASPLADASRPALASLLAVTGVAVLVPVPIHAERRRLRGYNQAELLARRLGPPLGLDVADVLERRLPTTKQHRLNRSARLQNLRGAFGLAAGAAVPKIAVVVDDIVTTTATMEACASTLRAGGCVAVYGFAVAREV